MGVDLSKVKERQQEEEARRAAQGLGGFSYWSPPKGKSRVRLLPPWTDKGPNKDAFFREVYVHFSVGLDEDSARTFACPAKTPHGPKAHCQICALVEKLRASGSPADAELADNIRAKQRFYTNIVDRNDPFYKDEDVAEWKARQEDKTKECPFAAGDTKVQVWSYGPMIWNDLMNIFMDTGVDITQLADGHDVLVTREGEKKKTKYSARADIQKTALEVKGRTLGEAQIDLDRIMPFPTAEAIAEALQGMPGYMSLGAPAQSAAPALPAPSSQSQQLKPPPAAAPPKDPPKSLPVASEADAPPCFTDLTTVNANDAECVGGKNKDGDEFDPCPYFEACNAALEASKAPKTRRSAAKRNTAAPTDTSQPSAVTDLEEQMRQALK